MTGAQTADAASLETLYTALGFRCATVVLKDVRSGQYRARVSFGADKAAYGSVVVRGLSTNIFDGSHNVIDVIKSNATVGSFTLSANPTNGLFADWGNDSSVNGNALTGTDIWISSVVCFAEGTAILTPAGEVPVETLAEGADVVVLRDGAQAAMPVKWMGVRHIDIARHPRPHTVAPVRIKAHAFGAGMPARDLSVSPAHCIFVDGKLVPFAFEPAGTRTVQVDGRPVEEIGRAHV